MKKLLMGLTAVVATSFAVPAFAEDKPAGEAKPAGEKPAKKAKKGKKAKPEGEAKPAEAPAK